MKWTCIYKTTSRFEAEAIQGNLDSAGIPCVILNKQDSSYLAFGYVEIHVPEPKVNDARIILNQNSFNPQDN
ncbi:MAG TPA: DUF2007 domain-containing protein [Chitinophagaceae bacterium]|nr:DUF2007 domain-containing protein [Chitinophagaceae bacterium]HNF71800.1 DUF2007 domain-containing protein [Chitinophagaceae bacterium]